MRKSVLHQRQLGFTLIELAIVLVIIGLIVGGILVGQSLISAAGVRAQITQIEKYNAAVNTFRGKYGYLPGDIPNPYASQFGFATRGTLPGEGNGNGVIQGNLLVIAGTSGGFSPLSGEQAMFWVDLSAARLIDGTFSTATPTTAASLTIAGAAIGQYLPQAKLGYGGFVYVWSGGLVALANNVYGYCPYSPCPANVTDSLNYFGLAAITGGATYGMPLLTVAQAYAIDKKMDDGLPQSGNVLAMDITTSGWAAGGPGVGFPPYEGNSGDYNSTNYGPVTSSSDIGDGTPKGANSCYDGNTQSSPVLPEQYSVEVNGGADANCVLSFRFQ